MPTRLQLLTFAAVGVLVVWLLPGAVDSPFVAGVLLVMLFASVVIGWRRHEWLLATIVGTLLVVTDLLGIARAVPQLLWLVIAVLWAGGTWLVGHIGDAQHQIFRQALASFLVVEVFLMLQLWPINLLSKAVMVVSFAFLLWHELVRAASPRQRIQESVIPFVLIVALMTLTGRWLSY